MYKILLFTLVIFLTACTKNVGCLDISECLSEKIVSFSKSSEVCANSTIKQYIFQTKEVYVLDVGTCSGGDIPTPVIDKNCNTIGFLGGLQGNIIINGESFTNAVYQKTIWKK